MFDIKGKHALVTGGATGIGLCYVKEMLKLGAAKVAVFDMDENAGRKMMTDLGKNVMFVKVDVTNAKMFEDAFKNVMTTFKTMDIVINNAGVMNDGKWEMEIAINFNAVVRGTMLAMQHMGRDMGGNGGVIINIASILGLQPLAGCPVYVGTKHAVIGFNRSWAMPFHYNRTGIRVLTMCPGVTDTPLISEAHGKQQDTLMGKECQRELDSMPKQPPSHVAEWMMHLIQHAENGSVWVCEGGEPCYEVMIPERHTLHKH